MIQTMNPVILSDAGAGREGESKDPMPTGSATNIKGNSPRPVSVAETPLGASAAVRKHGSFTCG